MSADARISFQPSDIGPKHLSRPAKGQLAGGGRVVADPDIDTPPGRFTSGWAVIRPIRIVVRILARAFVRPGSWRTLQRKPNAPRAMRGKEAICLKRSPGLHHYQPEGQIHYRTWSVLSACGAESFSKRRAPDPDPKGGDMNKSDVGLSQATRMVGICAVLTAAAWSTGFAATSRHSSSSEPPQVHPTSKPKAAQDQATKALPPPRPAPRGQETGALA